MTLRKFLTITNVGRFENYNAVGDVALKRFNLIFAENGRGKSTLCAILRSLQTNNPEYVLGRRTLGSVDPPHVHVLAENGAITFKLGFWSCAMPRLSIFDSTFIAENVFSGDAVDLDHRRNLYRVIIGKAGVDLAQRVNDLDAEIRSITSTIRLGRATVEGLLPSGFGLEAFVSLAADPSIEPKIAEKERELEAIQQSAQLMARPGVAQIVVPATPSGLDTLLERTIEHLSAMVEQTVSSHIVRHKMGRSGERWLQEGLSYIHDDSCPFCDQALEGVSLIPSLTTFFGDAYKRLKVEIADFRNELATAFSDRTIGEIERVIEANQGAVEFWSRYSRVVQAVVSSPQGFGRSLREFRDAALALLDRKAASPLEVICIDQRFNNALNVLTALRASVGEYNQAIATVQRGITERKNSLAGTNLAKCQGELQYLRAIKSRHTPKSIAACDAYVAAQKQKESLETQKENARGDLDQYTETIIKKYEQTINKLLKNFQAGFRITGTKHAYPGGVPSSSFQILINDVAVDLGDASTSLSEPSFRNTLSAGDKSTLALALFLAVTFMLPQNKDFHKRKYQIGSAKSIPPAVERALGHLARVRGLAGT